MNVLISNEAWADLTEIWSWTAAQFGRAQAERYVAALHREIGALESGSKRLRVPTDAPRYRVLRSGQHRIYLTFEGETIHIVRILHTAMDSLWHLPNLG